jgi:hypothetical protein
MIKSIAKVIAESATKEVRGASGIVVLKEWFGKPSKK